MNYRAVLLVTLLIGFAASVQAQTRTHTDQGRIITHFDESYALDDSGNIYYRTGSVYLAPTGETITFEPEELRGRLPLVVVTFDGRVIGGPLFYQKPWGPEPDGNPCYVKTRIQTHSRDLECKIYKRGETYSTPALWGYSCSQDVIHNRHLTNYIRRACGGLWLPEISNATQPQMDSDLDGVLNESDLCPSTAADLDVWKFGARAGCSDGQTPLFSW